VTEAAQRPKASLDERAARRRLEPRELLLRVERGAQQRAARAVDREGRGARGVGPARRALDADELVPLVAVADVDPGAGGAGRAPLAVELEDERAGPAGQPELAGRALEAHLAHDLHELAAAVEAVHAAGRVVDLEAVRGLDQREQLAERREPHPGGGGLEDHGAVEPHDDEQLALPVERGVDLRAPAAPEEAARPVAERARAAQGRQAGDLDVALPHGGEPRERVDRDRRLPAALVAQIVQAQRRRVVERRHGRRAARQVDRPGDVDRRVDRRGHDRLGRATGLRRARGPARGRLGWRLDRRGPRARGREHPTEEQRPRPDHRPDPRAPVHASLPRRGGAHGLGRSKSRRRRWFDGQRLPVRFAVGSSCPFVSGGPTRRRTFSRGPTDLHL
jgi:hypothetical protein